MNLVDQTIFHYFAKENHEKVNILPIIIDKIKTLREYSKNIDIYDNEGNTPRMLAEQSGTPEIMRCFESYEKSSL